MSIAQGILTALRDDTTLDGLISGAVYAEFAPQDQTPPYIIYQRIGTEQLLTLDGVDTLRKIRYRVDLYALTLKTLEPIKIRVYSLLHNNFGPLGGEAIQFAYISGEQDLSELEGDFAYRRVSLDLEITAHEG
jgi:hypothetical protein